MWRSNFIDLFVDISTDCNAGCPMCDRTDHINNCKTADWLPKINWTIDQFEKAYPAEVMLRIKHVDICGSWGDPLMNNDLIEIVSYIRKSNPRTDISIQTNGSLRNEDFWWRLGVAGGYKLNVCFAVEGTTQEMHEKYRQKTFLKKILNNMKVLSNTYAKVKSQTIIFSHNEPYLNDINKLCMENGSSHHREIYTDRKFDKNNRYNFIDAKGNMTYLERPIPKIQENKVQFIGDEGNIGSRIQIRRQDSTRNIDKKIIKEKKKTISCKWGNINRILVNPDGYVLPCCYFAVPVYRKYDYFVNSELMKTYFKAELNVLNKNLLDIINDEWYKKTLPTSWVDGSSLPQCHTYCGK